MFHWLFALSFVGAYLSAESEHWRLLHVTLGYSFAGLLVFRVSTACWARARRAWACSGASWVPRRPGCVRCGRAARSTGARARTWPWPWPWC